MHNRISNISERNSMLAQIVLISLFTAVLYINTLANGFVFDDNYVIFKNQWITDFGHLKDILFSSVWFFAEEHGPSDYYRPTLHLIASVEYRVFGIDPWGWHLVNIALHTFNALLVFSIAHTFFCGHQDKSPVLALASALIFAAHPVNTEAVNFISCLPDLLFTFFSLGAIYLHMRRLHIFSALFFFLTLLSKETAVVVPLVLFVYDKFKKGGGARFKAYTSYIVAFGLYMALRTYALAGVTARETVSQNLFSILLDIFPLFFESLKLLLMPINLSVFHVHEPATGLKIVISALFTGIVVWTALGLKRVKPETLFPASLVILPILPTFYLLFSGNMGLPAERYLYLPSAGLGMLAAQGIGSALLRFKGIRYARAIIFAGLFALLTLYSFKTITRNTVWKDDLTLWGATIRDFPDNYFAHYLLADVYKREGFLDKAMPHMQEAVRLGASDINMRHKLGLLYYEAGRNEDALAEFKEVLEKQPANSDVFYNIALIHMDNARWQDAEKALKKALLYAKKESRRLRIKNALAVVYARTDRIEAAKRELVEALRIDPADKETLGNLSGLSP